MSYAPRKGEECRAEAWWWRWERRVVLAKEDWRDEWEVWNLVMEVGLRTGVVLVGLGKGEGRLTACDGVR